MGKKLILLLFLMGCSSLETPTYKPASEGLRTPAYTSEFDLPENYQAEDVSLTDDLRLDWPVDQAKINRGFRQNKKRRYRHLGIDFGGQRGTPIKASHDGVVIYAGRAFKGYGNLVIVESRYGFATFYAHLDKKLVKEGELVPRGKKIGLMGRTGRATGVHLHFELRISKLPVDPLPFLQKNRLDRSLTSQSE